MDFALVQLSGGEVCRGNLVRVENFSQQLVAGFRYDNSKSQQFSEKNLLNI